MSQNSDENNIQLPDDNFDGTNIIKTFKQFVDFLELLNKFPIQEADVRAQLKNFRKNIQNEKNIIDDIIGKEKEDKPINPRDISNKIISKKYGEGYQYTYNLFINLILRYKTRGINEKTLGDIAKHNCGHPESKYKGICTKKDNKDNYKWYFQRENDECCCNNRNKTHVIIENTHKEHIFTIKFKYLKNDVWKGDFKIKLINHNKKIIEDDNKKYKENSNISIATFLLPTYIIDWKNKPNFIEYKYFDFDKNKLDYDRFDNDIMNIQTRAFWLFLLILLSVGISISSLFIEDKTVKIIIYICVAFISILFGIIKYIHSITRTSDKKIPTDVNGAYVYKDPECLCFKKDCEFCGCTGSDCLFDCFCCFGLENKKNNPMSFEQDK